MKSIIKLVFLTLLMNCNSGGFAQNGKTFLRFEGKEGSGKCKNVVLISGDDEYRSKESMPMMVKILSTHYGFTTTVLFQIEPETENILLSYQNNIPGLEHLATADLVIMRVHPTNTIFKSKNIYLDRHTSQFEGRS